MSRVAPASDEVRLSNDHLLKWITKTPSIDGRKPYTLIELAATSWAIVWPWQVQNTGLYDFLWQSNAREQFIIATANASYAALPNPTDFPVWSFFWIKAFGDILVTSFFTNPWWILPSWTLTALWVNDAIWLSAWSSAVWVTDWTTWNLIADYSDPTPYTAYTTATLPTAPVAWSPVTLPTNAEKYAISTAHPTNSNIILPNIQLASWAPAFPLRIVNRDLLIFNNTTNTYIINTTRTDMLYAMNILPWQTLLFKSNLNSITNQWTLVHEHNPLKLTTSVSNATTALADVTGLWVSLVANRSYRFKYVIAYTSAATWTGSVWSLNWPAWTCHYTTEWSNTSTNDADVSWQWYNSVVWLSAWSASTTSNVCIIEWVITPTSNGTLIPRFRSELAWSAITALANFSYLDIKRL